MAAAAFGKIFGIVGGILQNKAAFDEKMGAASKFKFDSQMALRNAELARQDQLIAAESGAVDRSNISKGEAVTRGETRSSFAGGNVRVDEGTPLEFDIAVAEQAATERERSKDDEAIKIHKLEIERQGLLAEAKLLRKAAKRTKRSAKTGFTGGVFSSVGGMMK